ncbi:MAG: SH3 domain-containing protein [Magnetococcales bacterium]|nr:SH3 domain-containing protein [Magnetococcales bacterium]
MIKKSTIYWAVLGICLIFLPGNLQAETLYTKKSGVTMTSNASPKSKVVKKLEKGVAVTVLKKSKRYFQVRLKNRTTGWVYRFHLSKKAPRKQSGSSSEGLLSTLGGRSSVAVHESSSNSSIRGMQPATRAYAKSRHINTNHVKALEWMKQFSVSDNELLKFQENGSLGEFSGAGL